MSVRWLVNDGYGGVVYAALHCAVLCCAVSATREAPPPRRERERESHPTHTTHPPTHAPPPPTGPAGPAQGLPPHRHVGHAGGGEVLLLLFRRPHLLHPRPHAQGRSCIGWVVECGVWVGGWMVECGPTGASVLGGGVWCVGVWIGRSVSQCLPGWVVGGMCVCVCVCVWLLSHHHHHLYHHLPPLPPPPPLSPLTTIATITTFR